MLKDSFFKVSRVLEQTEAVVRLGITLIPEHPVYDGHFPGNPVTPGACMIQMIKELVADHLGRKVLLTESRQIKFLNLLIPDRTSELELSIETVSADASCVTVKAQIADSSCTYLKFSGKFKLDGKC